MTKPTIIIEIRGGNLAALYSNADITFYLIDRDNEEKGDQTISGPFSPTLEKADLSKVFPDEPAIANRLTDKGTPVAYF